jgi:NAD(P)-dependent dehydrogenase (short-subunit alcohol dehydrogenase family)
LSLDGKVVLITGATSAVGRGLADAFRRAGATVALAVPRRSDLAELQRQIESQPGSFMAEACDLRSEDEVIRLVHRVAHRFGRLDVVINAGAVLGPKALVMDYPVEPWRNVLATNVTGTYLVCREALPWMSRQNSGSIINITSGLARAVRPEWGANVVSSHSVDALSRLLAAEVKGSGVRVNTVEVSLPLLEGRTQPAERDWTEAFLWLASDASASANGQRIRAAEFTRAVH